MTRINTTIEIERPIAEVFNYVTTPANWLQWHPSCQAVSGATGHSLAVGEQVTEEFVVAGRSGRGTWTVLEREAPHHWLIEAMAADKSGNAKITYTLTEKEGKTNFERELVYSISKPLLALLDWLVLRHRVSAESTTALQKLKAVMEEG